MAELGLFKLLILEKTERKSLRTTPHIANCFFVVYRKILVLLKQK